MQSSSWETNSCSANPEIPSISWCPRVHYSLHNSPPLVQILSQMKPVHALLSYFFRYFLILFSHLYLGIPSGIPPSGFPSKTHNIFLFYPIYAIWPTHLILLAFITRIIFGEQYRSLSSTLCSALHSSVTPSLSDPNILPQYPILKHPQPTFLPQCDWPSFTPIQTTGKIIFLYSSTNLYCFCSCFPEFKRKLRDSSPRGVPMDENRVLFAPTPSDHNVN